MTEDEELLNILDDYIQTRLPDHQDLAELLELAKGSGRSMGRFAGDCGYSPVLFSRIKNHKFTEPLDKKLLLAIAEHSVDLVKPAFLHRLLEANGMTNIQDEEQYKTLKLLEKWRERDEKITNLEKELQGIIIMTLVKRHYTITYIDRIPDIDARSMITGEWDHEFALQLTNYDTKYVYFCFLTTLPEDMVDPPGSSDPMDYESMSPGLVKDISKLLLMSYWYPESFKQVRTVLVVNDEEVYNEYTELLTGPVNADVAVILVDTETKKVTSEYHLKEASGQEFKPMFGDQ